MQHLGFGRMLGNREAIGRLHFVLDNVVVGALHAHITSVILKVQGAAVDIKGHKAVGSLIGIGTKPLGVGTDRNTVVAVAGFSIACATGENKVSAFVLVVSQAVIMAVDDNSIVFANNFHQRVQLGVIGGGGHIAVVDLQDLPSSVGLSKRLAQEVHLFLGFLVAGDHIIGVVNGGVDLVLVNKAIGVHDHEGCSPIRAGQVVRVVRQVLVSKVPAVIKQGRKTRLEINTGLASDNVVVAESLIPGLVVEGLADVHISPALVEALDTFRCEVHTAVVEVVADRHKGIAVLLKTDLFDVASCAGCKKR